MTNRDEYSFDICCDDDHQAVIESLRSITPERAAEIVRSAGIVSEDGELNPIYR